MEPTKVTIAALTPRRPSPEAHRDHHFANPDRIRNIPRARCVIRSTAPIATDYVATAFLPPLMLVNRESHGVAARHYKRALKNLAGGGGVLAAYPTELRVEDRALHALVRRITPSKRAPPRRAVARRGPGTESFGGGQGDLYRRQPGAYSRYCPAHKTLAKIEPLQR